MAAAHRFVGELRRIRMTDRHADRHARADQLVHDNAAEEPTTAEDSDGLHGNPADLMSLFDSQSIRRATSLELGEKTVRRHLKKAQAKAFTTGRTPLRRPCVSICFRRSPPDRRWTGNPSSHTTWRVRGRATAHPNVEGSRPGWVARLHARSCWQLSRHVARTDPISWHRSCRSADAVLAVFIGSQVTVLLVLLVIVFPSLIGPRDSGLVRASLLRTWPSPIWGRRTRRNSQRPFCQLHSAATIPSNHRRVLGPLSPS